MMENDMIDDDLLYHVSPEGSDDWNGSAPEGSDDWNGSALVRRVTDGPFATLQRAVEAARFAGKGRRRTIVVDGGCYYDTAVSIGPEDAGLTIRGAEGETSLLYGGRKINGWQKEEQGEFWFATLPAVAAGEWDFRLLVVNNRACDRARLPERGEFLHETAFDVAWLSTTAGGWARQPTEGELVSLQYKDGDLGSWLNIKNAELTVYHKWDESAVGIDSHDTASRTLRLSHPCGHPPGAFGSRRFVVWNVREGMKRPGQWYLDRTAGRIVYWPQPGETIDDIVAIAPTADCLIRFSGHIRDVTLANLSLEVSGAPLMAAEFGAYLMPGAIEASEGLENCRFEGLAIRNTGGHGIKISGSCSDVDIRNCSIEHTGAGGIVFHNDAQNDCLIANNQVRHVGRVCTSAIAISGHRCKIIANVVSDAPYSGIVYSGSPDNSRNDHGALIEDNTVSRVMRFLNDGGAIYVTFTQHGMIRGNVIRDIQQGSEPDTGRNGIYLDEQTEEWIVERNIVVDCTHPTLNHMAQRNVFRENLFSSASWLKVSALRCSEYVFERNVFLAHDKLMFAGNPDAVKEFRDNLLYSGTGKYEQNCIDEHYNQYDVRALTINGGSMIADPLFTDEAAGDYTLKPESPLFKLGITGFGQI